MILRFVVTGVGPVVLDRGIRLALFQVRGRTGQRYRLGHSTARVRWPVGSALPARVLGAFHEQQL
jgi:hypothetical protein